MEYTVNGLARLAGVSVRTLHWYDEIGLLRPARVTEAGYRMYGFCRFAVAFMPASAAAPSQQPVKDATASRKKAAQPGVSAS